MIHEAPLNFRLTANQSPAEGRAEERQAGVASLPPGDTQGPVPIPGDPGPVLLSELVSAKPQHRLKAEQGRRVPAVTNPVTL